MTRYDVEYRVRAMDVFGHKGIPMTTRQNRRQFLQSTSLLAAAGACGTWSELPAAESKSPNEKLNVAFIGVANKGGDNLSHLLSENVAALCDVDSTFLGRAKSQHPKAETYTDYRTLLEKGIKHLDAVVVSTTDHHHAPATMRALAAGKHVYCEKPLTHSVQEARLVAELAKKQKVVTQMGTQIQAGENYRRVVELIQSGAIGTVTEVYNWCNKGWSNGRFGPEKPKPANLDWEVWLGPAKNRPYFEVRVPHDNAKEGVEPIHPFYWRRFWEYGSGTFGDMACHVMDLPFWALGLTYPTRVEAKGPPVHADGAPAWCMADYEFVREGKPLPFHWSDGGKHHDLVAKTLGHNGKPLSTWGLGVLFVGEKGMLAADYGHNELLPQKQFADFQPPKASIPRSIGHWQEFATACKTGGPTTCNFQYSGMLTETVLLGVVAYRISQKLEWDAKSLKATNCPEADAFIRKDYRSGWELTG